MSDIEMVRGLYDEPSAPTPRAVAEARARMTVPEDAAGPVRPARSGRRQAAPHRARPSTLARPGRPVVLGLLATGAAAAIAVGLLTVPDGGGAGPATGTSPAVSPSKRMVLAAAHRAEQQPMKRYRLLQYKHCNAVTVRAETGDYVTEACTENYVWGTRSSSGESAYWARTLPTLPRTPKDKAAWRRAGSPRTFPYPQDPRALPDAYKTRGTPWQEDKTGRNRGASSFAFGIGRSSLDSVEDLPTDPERLTALLTPVWSASMAGPPSAGDKLVRTQLGVLEHQLPPKVRAAVIRLLAEQPGVESIGRIEDPLGRTGVALTGLRHGYVDPKSVTRVELILDPATGELLAMKTVMVRPGKKERQGPGSLLAYTAVIKSEWTDTRPPDPR